MKTTLQTKQFPAPDDIKLFPYTLSLWNILKFIGLATRMLSTYFILKWVKLFQPLNRMVKTYVTRGDTIFNDDVLKI